MKPVAATLTSTATAARASTATRQPLAAAVAPLSQPAGETLPAYGPTKLSPALRSICPCGGGCPRCTGSRPGPAPLTIGRPDDRDEAQAERIAERVEQDDAASPRRPAEWVVRSGEARGGGGHGTHVAPPIVREVLASPGMPLPDAERAFFEPRLGQGLGAIRVHADAHAALSARAIGARAFAVGPDLVFGAREYAPHTAGGRRLLAHELVHALQRSTTTIRRAETPDAPTATESPTDAPVEVPPNVSPVSEQLARSTAERIDDVVAAGWDRALQRGSAALLLADQVNGQLCDTFEQHHGTQPQLNKSEAPVLQYFVAQHPGLRERLAVLRYMAGGPFTEPIGHYLDIPLAAAGTFSYQLSMVGFAGGEGVEGSRQRVRIRYLEDGKPVWDRVYAFVAAGTGVGLVPISAGGDILWNEFYTPEYWSPEDFGGTMVVMGAGGGYGPFAWEVEGATMYGSGTHAPIGADIGGWIWTTPSLGASEHIGKLVPMGLHTPAPPPGKGVLPAPPRYVQRPEVRASLVIYFDTDDDQLDDAANIDLMHFVESYREVFDGGDYQLTLVGQASRIGDPDYNKDLSARRVASVRAGIQERLDHPLIEDQVGEAALGELLGELEDLPDTNNAAEYRSVEIGLRGRVERELPAGP
jgi:hypothetical protein